MSRAIPPSLAKADHMNQFLMSNGRPASHTAVIQFTMILPTIKFNPRLAII
jgi:hypothetical protein